jgi:hypothetical protein
MNSASSLLENFPLNSNPESKIALWPLNTGTVRESKAGACSLDLQRREQIAWATR